MTITVYKVKQYIHVHFIIFIICVCVCVCVSDSITGQEATSRQGRYLNIVTVTYYMYVKKTRSKYSKSWIIEERISIYLHDVTCLK